MVRFVSLYTAFDSKVKQKILFFLLGSYTPMSERELARILEVSHASVNRIMREFSEIDLVYSNRVGNAVVWNINRKSLAYAELKKFPSILVSPLNHLIRTISLALASQPIERVVIFGSVAEGRERPGSDIDLFILTPDDKTKSSLTKPLESLGSKCLELYGNCLQPYVLTEEEFNYPSNKHLLGNIEKGIPVFPEPAGRWRNG